MNSRENGVGSKMPLIVNNFSLTGFIYFLNLVLFFIQVQF